MVLNVTVTAARDPGYVTVWPCGSPIPNASNLNYTAGATIPNTVIAKIGTGGKVCLFTEATVHLIADMNAYYPAGAPFVPLVPGRLLDTRQPASATVDHKFEAIGARPAGSVTELDVTGRHGVPADAAAVVLNVTVTAARDPGYVTVWPCGSPIPNASNLNYTAGATIPNTVIAKIGTGGKVCLFTEATVHLIADINAYYPAGAPFVPLVPGRLLDTRQPASATVDHKFEAIGARPAGSVTELDVTGRHGVPADAAAVVLNVTVTAARDPGYVTVWPCGSPIPNASNLNYTAGATIPNTVIAKIGTGGKVCLFTEATVHLIADINAYYPAGIP